MKSKNVGDLLLEISSKIPTHTTCLVRTNNAPEEWFVHFFGMEYIEEDTGYINHTTYLKKYCSTNELPEILDRVLELSKNIF